MNDEKRTDYKTSTPEVLYEARKIVIKMWKKDYPVKATPHKARLTAWRHICLHIFRHLAQKFFAGRQPGISVQQRIQTEAADE